MTIYTAQYHGNSCQLVEVQSHLSNGYSGVTTVGNISKTCQDGVERARVALEKCGIDLPAQKLVLSFAPASLRKDGNQFDLPMAVSIAKLLEEGHYSSLPNCLYVGELDLLGNVKTVKSLVSFILLAVEKGIPNIICPLANRDSVRALLHLREDLLKEVDFYFVEDLAQVLRLLDSRDPRTGCWKPHQQSSPTLAESAGLAEGLTFDDMVLSEEMERAALVTTVGKHNVLLRGCPGSGKSMWASRLASIQPKLSRYDHMENLKIYSSVGEPIDTSVLIGRPPFRSPHHQASAAAILGTPYQAGELTLSYGGLLFLDELPEFRRDLLEALREPLETGEIQISRANQKVIWKSKTQLIAACNNCPCGWFGSSVQRCTCSISKLTHYYQKLSGPLLDRIDIHILFSKPQVQSMGVFAHRSKKSVSKSSLIKNKVNEAIAFSEDRLINMNVSANSQLSASNLLEAFAMDTRQFEKLTRGLLSYYKSTRGLLRALKVARTLADIDPSTSVKAEHLEQAKQWSSQHVLERIGIHRVLR